MQVKIQNKLNSVLELPVKDEHGIVQSVKVQARQTYGPVDEGRLTQYTRRLAATGRIRIRRA